MSTRGGCGSQRFCGLKTPLLDGRARPADGGWTAMLPELIFVLAAGAFVILLNLNERFGR
jgi:hypothetical protein